MASHTAPIVEQVQQEFQDLVGYVTGPETARSTAYEVERTLFRRLLGLGLSLLRLFFLTRATTRPPVPARGAEAPPWTAHGRRPTTYRSVFGRLTFERHAFSAPGQPMAYPLDASLSLPANCYSDLLREWAAYGSTDAAYRETQALLERILGQNLSVQAIETGAAADAADVPAFFEQPPDPAAPAALGSLLVAQADGKGVPLVLPPRAARPARRGKGHPPDRKREAIVTALYTIAPYVRTPQGVVAALLREADDRPHPTRPRPVGKELRASLDGKDAALSRLAQRVAQREHAAIAHRVALTDGAEALQQRMRTHLPGFTLVLDIIHASEYLWDVANALLGERHPDRHAWMHQHLEQVLSGQTAAVIAELGRTAADPALTTSQRAVLERTVGYYQRNQPYMHYDEYLARGWPIGTGVVEGACGHLVKDRMEQAGMRWTQAGAQAVLDLRAVRLTGTWDAYWAFHRQQQHQRLYGPDASLPTSPEAHLLEPAA